MWDLQDLEEAVEVAAKDPSRFNLTLPEVQDRKKFIATLKKQVQSISSELTSGFACWFFSVFVS
jgi:hypothetical protein